MRDLVQDVRYAARLLLRSPGFTFVAVAALALGIGANTAIFSVVDTLLLRPLPYVDADRLAVVWEHNLPRDRKNNVVSPGNFIHWREMNHVFEDMAAVGLTFNLTPTGGGGPGQGPFPYGSPRFFPIPRAAPAFGRTFFPILGVAPALGRSFTADEDRPHPRVVVISDRLWRRRFSADPGVLSRAITLEGDAYNVVGVMPPGFSFMDRTVDAWVPIGLSA